MFAEIGEVLAGKKTLPKVPDCGKNFIIFKSLGRRLDELMVSTYHPNHNNIIPHVINLGREKAAEVGCMEHLTYPD